MSSDYLRITHHSSRTKGSPWFRSANPMPPERKCPSCKWVLGLDEGAVIKLDLEPQKGAFWADLIGAGGGLLGLYVSERVIRDWARAGIQHGPVRRADVTGEISSRFKEAPPTYYYVLPVLGPELDITASGLTPQGKCPSCGTMTFLKDPMKDKSFVFRSDRSSGMDLFVSEYSYALTFCTKRVAEVALLNGHTNAAFSFSTAIGTRLDDQQLRGALAER